MVRFEVNQWCHYIIFEAAPARPQRKIVVAEDEEQDKRSGMVRAKISEDMPLDS